MKMKKQLLHTQTEMVAHQMCLQRLVIVKLTHLNINTHTQRVMKPQIPSHPLHLAKQYIHIPSVALSITQRHSALYNLNKNSLCTCVCVYLNANEKKRRKKNIQKVSNRRSRRAIRKPYSWQLFIDSHFRTVACIEREKQENKKKTTLLI